MNMKKSTAFAASIAVAAAFALIVASTYSGFPITTTLGSSVGQRQTSTESGLTQSSQVSSQLSSTGQSSTAQSSTQQSSQQTTSQQTTSQQTTSQQTTSKQTTSQTSNQQAQGTLAVLLTDPPNAPVGVTKVYVTYVDLAVHVSGMDNNSGWTILKTSGSIELMGTVNISQTISSARISSGSYNLVRFDITNAVVTYGGLNYTAFVPTSVLTVPIVNGVMVSSSAPAATIIDISPTVINVGSQSSPEFIIQSVAFAYPVTSSTATLPETVLTTVGSKMGLMGLTWWSTIQQKYTADLSIGAASMNETYLNLKVLNTGGNSTVLNLVTVTPVVNATAAGHQGVLPTALGQSAIFIVLKNGTLVQLQLFMHSMMGATSASAISVSLFSQRGVVLPPGATATLTHPRGTILLGFMGMAIETPVGLVIKGHQYLVTVIGEQTSASVVVTAS